MNFNISYSACGTYCSTLRNNFIESSNELIFQSFDFFDIIENIKMACVWNPISAFVLCYFKDTSNNSRFTLLVKESSFLTTWKQTSMTTTSSSSPSSSPSLDETNTIILRDVHPLVTETEIRALLDSVKDGPTIIQIKPDIADCWYVLLE